MCLNQINSFQGGFGASGPSQDQVYEAMEIFGEGIQDFDFNADADDGVAEVRDGFSYGTCVSIEMYLIFSLLLTEKPKCEKREEKTKSNPNQDERKITEQIMQSCRDDKTLSTLYSVVPSS